MADKLYTVRFKQPETSVQPVKATRHELTGQRWIHSFTTVEGQPQWAVHLQDGTWLFVDRGMLIHDTSSRRRRAQTRRHTL